MFDDIYNRKILELAANIPRLGRLEAPQASAEAHSRLCGSSIIVDLSLSDGKVADYAQDVKACALGQAASSVMGRHIIGATPHELRTLRETMRSMFKENGPPPLGRFADAGVLEPARDYKARHASMLLVFDAVVAALDKIEKGGAVGPRQ
ncbi:iron-sulfur cluster assembly scaffold protein [Rhodoblastus sp.]|jgi:NifU-like protein involved in Fe-S cluster formation|uniref:iron-sulfur cluster assembly scaffold protein n=1 Tax=Rhodoblastus sp. TaxID=1962975 RepID=UPI0026327259|nr:iron-sulfur cluster assembly scaffold protein [Rhodoblastus sp.]